MLVLGVETSCDETGIALYHGTQGLLSEALHSQVILHGEYGGVVPELASRDHVRRIIPLIKKVLFESGKCKEDIDAVAYTCGPGLIGALLVGICVGRTLAFALGVPAVAVHHMEGHLLSPMLEPVPPRFPFVALLVSGGHTLLMQVRGVGQYVTLGKSLDDAAGEAFDKVSVMLGMGYPGGPSVAALAEKGKVDRFTFPRPMLKSGLDFSFSGLKTYTIQCIKKNCGEEELDEQMKADIARAFEEAVVETLTVKCQKALRHCKYDQLVIAGGVGANKRLRENLECMVKDEGAVLLCPRPEFCTDNGAMIAYAGYRRLAAGHKESLSMVAKSGWDISTLEGI